MIIIKLTEGLIADIPRSCDYCPFMRSSPELYYGECMGYDNCWCGLTNDDIGTSYELPSERLSNCPIVSIEEES